MTIWNGMITNARRSVVRAASVDDVVRTVRFAADHDIELSIRGGGHNIAGLALCDGGLTLDMSAPRCHRGRPGRADSRASRPAPCSATWIGRPRRTGSRHRWASSRRPAWPG